ncbi:hypothetical protein Tco_0007485 [Tanacetum coccineum]
MRRTSSSSFSMGGNEILSFPFLCCFGVISSFGTSLLYLFDPVGKVTRFHGFFDLFPEVDADGSVPDQVEFRGK